MSRPTVALGGGEPTPPARARRTSARAAWFSMWRGAGRGEVAVGAHAAGAVDEGDPVAGLLAEAAHRPAIRASPRGAPCGPGGLRAPVPGRCPALEVAAERALGDPDQHADREDEDEQTSRGSAAAERHRGLPSAARNRYPKPRTVSISSPCIAQLGAEPLDVHVHGAGLDVGLGFPDGLEQLRAALHPAAPLQQRDQQLVFGGRERQLLPVDASRGGLSGPR